ncbi:hypothetical protein Tco_0639849 [Tanacetum coccineum]
MAASGSSRAVARRAMDDIANLSDETEVPKYMRFFFLQQIADDKAFANLLSDQAETARNFNQEAIRMKEGHVEVMDEAISC